VGLPSYVMVSIVSSLLRFLPLRSKTGLIRLGNPDRHSPVLLTGNYVLTVSMAKRALAGIDAFLLVANSRGINVWCAATGGHFTAHDVISTLKTSGIERLVDHRKVVLPQLAATGIEATMVKERCRWQVIWGPVRVRDIPAFLMTGFQKTLAMRQVEFPWKQRLEMAVAWAFPISVIPGIIMVSFWPQAVAMLVSLVWGLSLLIFACFPLYSRWLSPKGTRVGFVFFDFGRGGLQLVAWGIVIVGLLIYSLSTADHGWAFFLRWAFVSLVLVLIVSLDLMGSTPLYKSGLHEERWLGISMDEAKCRGAGFCEQVCPRDCYEMDLAQHKAALLRPDRCVQCGACVVQCPFDALFFRSPQGDIVPPETIREFKLNLMGKRMVRVRDENR
jgi:NAD-dependent dihydropyrimidine dehydrogenase PreA subunit